MTKHLVPQDSFNHIEDIACGCNPVISIAEGEEIYIHKEIPTITELRTIQMVENYFKLIDDEQNTNK